MFLSGGCAQHGVGIALSPPFVKQIENVSFYPFSARLCPFKFSIHDLKFASLAYHFPTAWDDIAEVEGTYHLLDLAMMFIDVLTH